MNFWYLVADGSRARLFQTNRRGGELSEIAEYVNEKGRLLNQDFDTDRGGRAFKGGNRRTTYEKAESPREREEKRFAQRLAGLLNEAKREHKFDRVGIIAPAKMLGRIRGELNRAVIDAVVGTSSKNLTQQGPEDIGAHIDTELL